MADGGDPIFSPIVLPVSGRKVRNRLVKVSLYEHLATLFGGPPNQYHFQLYSKWSAYDWGMIFTGNIQVSPQHLCLARDLVLPNGLSKQNLKSFRQLASAMRGEREQQPLAIMQLSHAGRQSPNILGGRFPFTRPLGPSSIRLGSSLKHKGILSNLLHRIMFQIPRSMSLADIDDVVNAFVRGAKLAAQTGYDGVELHAAHGYLLAQFMSPKSNQRTDKYSCSPSNALRLLHRIVLVIRAAVPSNFILGLKLNAADYTDSGEVSRALNHLRTIAEWRMVDFIEISGGDYEKPDFLTHSALPSARQALFAEFSRQALDAVESIPHGPLILLTGGLATPAQLHGALNSRHAHLLGLGRSAVLCPDLPAHLKQKCTPDSHIPFGQQPDLGVGADAWHWILVRLPRIKLLGAGVAMAWYVVALRRLTTPGSPLRRPDYMVRGMGGIVWMWAWFGPELSRFHTGTTQPRFLFLSGFVAVAAVVLVWLNVMHMG
ncbi:hypothetical protein B0H16DRAFT_1367650 [Mycena metata]|uniref:NADH:flavin oxidoreductase/NADH oxidase N-terminal domain-containing protein n=1 Tax=Mycena metata TaxID=1033252 RepID=A0AAD7JLC7_9AGAR|nr:hypothetical protein B0H16DRAFT_1367650 [Mycena metata]